MKTINFDDVVLLRCINGEEIIARYISKDDEGVTVRNAVTIHLSQTPTGQMAAQLIPSLLGNDEDDEVVIPYSAIMMAPKSGPRKDLKNKYIEMTTGIQLIK